MKDFRLYCYTNNSNNKVLITDSSNLSSAATYEESLTIQENDYLSFSCKIAKYINENEINKFFNLFHPNVKLRLEIDEFDGTAASKKSTKIYLLVIRKITPSITANNEIITIEANDFASVRFASRGSNLNMTETGNIVELAKAILAEGKLNSNYEDAATNYFNSYTIASPTNCRWTDDGLEIDAAADASTPTNASFTYSTADLDFNDDYISYKGSCYLPGGVISDYSDFNISSSTSTITYTFINSNTFKVYVKDFTIKQIFNNLIVDKELWIIDDSCLENFKVEDYEISSSKYKKSTIDLSNSTVYNGLVTLCDLFNAAVHFDYDNKKITFENKANRTYKGYKLNPTINLNSFSRNTSSNNMISVMDIYGGEVDDETVNIIPEAPPGFKEYFADCVKNNFNSSAYFQSYGGLPNQLSYQRIRDNLVTNADGILPKTYLSAEQEKEYKQELDDYATILDYIPNNENRKYNFDYFKNQGLIKNGSIEENDSYSYLMDAINNKLRKINIKTRYYSDVYWTLYSNLELLKNNIQNVATATYADEQSFMEMLDMLAVEDYDGSTGHEEPGETHNFEYIDENGVLHYVKDTFGGESGDSTYSYTTNTNTIIFGVGETPLLPTDQEEENGYTIFSHTLSDAIAQNGALFSAQYYYRPDLDMTSATRDLSNCITISGTTLYIIVEGTGIIKQQYFTNNPCTIYYKTTANTHTYTRQNNYKAIAGSISNLINDSLNEIEQLDNLVGIKRDNYITSNTSILGYKSALNTMISLGGTNNYNLLTNSQYLPYNLILMYGLSRGVNRIAKDYNDKVQALRKEEKEIKEKIYPLLKQITKETNFSIKANYEAEYEGWIARLKTIYKYVGYSQDGITSHGLYQIILDRLNKLKAFNSAAYSSDIEEPIDHYYDLIENYFYVREVNGEIVARNLIFEKDLILNELKTNFEDAWIEGYYENSEEIESKNLFIETQVKANENNYPITTYNAGIIDLSAIEDYKFLKVAVGDKILIDENTNLYYDYNPNNQKYLVVSEIKYSSLREPDKTSLTVNKNNEDANIIRAILKSVFSKK